MPATKSAPELQAEIDGLLLTPGADGCASINGKVTREVCPKVAELRTEKARADRRAESEAIIAIPLPTLPQSPKQSVSAPDPAASALSAYLAFFGIVVSPAVLSEWLILLGLASPHHRVPPTAAAARTTESRFAGDLNGSSATHSDDSRTGGRLPRIA